MKVVPIQTPETYDLRGRILRPGYPPEASQFPHDARSVHFGAFKAGGLSPVCVVTAHEEASPLWPSDPAQWRIRGMATDDGVRGQGVGTRVLKELLNWGRANGVASFWCNARAGALDFYAREGFTIESEMFEIPEVGPHKIMRIVL